MSARPKEPSTAPQAEHWYPLVLGSSLKDQPSKRFYSLRYEFKPASIDTSRPGTLHKGAENKVTVELSNNQPGKPKVSFQGISEDCKDSDAILFFDGRTFRLERLHRAVKALRHVRQPGESTSAAALTSGAGADTSRSPLHLNGTNGDDSNIYRGPREHVEEIVIGGQPDAGTSGSSKKNDKKPADNNRKGKTKASSSPANTVPAPTSSDRKRNHPEGSPPLFDETTANENSKKLKAPPQDNVEHIDINIDDEGGAAEHESDYELEDVDVSEDEDGQVNTKLPADNSNMTNNNGSNNGSAKSSSSSGSSSSESGSASSSDSDGSDDESASLGEI